MFITVYNDSDGKYELVHHGTCSIRLEQFIVTTVLYNNDYKYDSKWTIPSCHMQPYQISCSSLFDIIIIMYTSMNHFMAVQFSSVQFSSVQFKVVSECSGKAHTCFPPPLSAVSLVLPLMGDVAQWLESRNSNPKTLGSIPRRGRVKSSFPVPPSQLLCADLFVPDCPPPPHFMCTACTNMFAHIKIPYPSVVKE